MKPLFRPTCIAVAAILFTGIGMTTAHASAAAEPHNSSASHKASAPHASKHSAENWKEAKLINDESVQDPTCFVNDGQYILATMANQRAPVGLVNLFDKDGTCLSIVDIGFQPTNIVKTGDNTYWASNNNGLIKEILRTGTDLALTGKTEKIGEGNFCSMAMTGPSRLTAIVDNGEIVTIASYNTATGEKTVSAVTDELRPGYYSAFADGTFWTTAHTGPAGAVRLIGVDPETAKITHTFNVGKSPKGVAVDARGDLWVVDSVMGTVNQVDPSTGVVKKHIKVPSGEHYFPVALAYSPKLDRLAVTVVSGFVDNSSVAIVDPKAGKLLTDVKLSGEYPMTVAFTTNDEIWAGNIRHSVGQNDGGTISILNLEPGQNDLLAQHSFARQASETKNLK